MLCAVAAICSDLSYYEFQIFKPHHVSMYFYFIPLGASTYIELELYKDAVKCCDEGLAISFDILKSFPSIPFLWLKN